MGRHSIQEQLTSNAMKTATLNHWVLAVLLLAGGSSMLQAQNYSIGWSKIAGGGGTSVNGPYTFNGTIGQPDASGTATSGQYAFTGGFWAFLGVVPTPGAPKLYISHSGSTVTVFWPDVSGWSLQQNNNLATPAGWSVNSSWTTSNGTNYLNLTSPTGYLFFRLSSP